MTWIIDIFNLFCAYKSVVISHSVPHSLCSGLALTRGERPAILLLPPLLTRVSQAPDVRTQFPSLFLLTLFLGSRFLSVFKVQFGLEFVFSFSRKECRNIRRTLKYVEKFSFLKNNIPSGKSDSKTSVLI